MTELKNKAGQMGANVVLVATGSNTMGEAYLGFFDSLWRYMEF